MFFFSSGDRCSDICWQAPPRHPACHVIPRSTRNPAATACPASGGPTALPGPRGGARGDGDGLAALSPRGRDGEGLPLLFLNSQRVVRRQHYGVVASVQPLDGGVHLVPSGLAEFVGEAECIRSLSIRSTIVFVFHRRKHELYRRRACAVGKNVVVNAAVAPAYLRGVIECCGAAERSCIIIRNQVGEEASAARIIGLQTGCPAVEGEAGEVLYLRA